MLKYTLALVALLGLSMVPLARAAEVPGPDLKFVNNAVRDGEVEVALGKLAAEKASSEEVKKLGQQMADDHSKANEELKSLAESKKIDLTRAQAGATKRSEGMSQKLRKLEGEEFDKGYVAIMVKEHEKDVKAFEKESKDGEDAEIKAFAAKTLPTLQHHLEMVKEVQKKVGGGAASSDDAGKPKLGPTDGEAKKSPGESDGGKKD
ncbi:MAG: putative rane protein [Phycisphaerales bacterium]|jgi:putative membrane protein|nr:putative rane protein [Phycisphaerales bacterium]